MEKLIHLPKGDTRLAVTGMAERNLKIIREALGVAIASRDEALRLRGDQEAVGQAAWVIQRLSEAARHHQPMSRHDLLETLAQTEDHPSNYPAQKVNPMNGEVGSVMADKPPRGEPLEVYHEHRRVKPLTPGQREYLEAIQDHDLTLCVGPAGTGKTYVAVAAAVAMLKRGAIRRLVLVRPAVEAGEKIGFLPGSMQEKVNPYLRPLLDALHDMMDYEQIERFMAADLIEVIPLAFMRGRTLNDACVILDEAQNTTRSQMLMFLTRLGHGSKMVVTGDTSQIDLEDPRESGLVDAAHRLGHTRGVAMAALGEHDIVRHHLVQRIVEAYGQTGRRQQVDLGEDDSNQTDEG